MSDLLEQRYYGDHIRGYLCVSDGRCVFDIAIENRSFRPWIHVAFAIYGQARDIEGYAIGPCFLILECKLAIHAIAMDRWVWKRVELPERLSFAVARECYFVIKTFDEEVEEDDVKRAG